MAVTGEKRWSTEGKQAKKFNFEPLPAGVYTGRLVGDSIQVKSDPGKAPRIGCSFAYDVPNQEKPRKVYHWFYLSLKQGKDGVTSPERANGILGFARSVGEDAEFSTISRNVAQYDKNRNIVGQEEIDCLHPLEVKKWLMAHDGIEMKAKLRIKPDRDGNKSNEVDNFIEVEEANAFASSADDSFEETAAEVTEETVEQLELSVDSLGEETDAEAEEEEAPPPPPKKAVKAAPAATKTKKR